MGKALDLVLERLDVEELEVNLFRGWSPQTELVRVFGGQVLGQALMAASRTVGAGSCHSLHSYFLRPGDPRAPIVYEVDRIRDGRSFTTRRVRAVQHGRAIFSMDASFHVAEDGVEHGLPAPAAPDPESLPSSAERVRALRALAPEHLAVHFQEDRAIDSRSEDPFNPFEPQCKGYSHVVWMRPTGPLPVDDLLLHQCILAWASDMTMLDSACRAHAIAWTNPDNQIATIDHSMWFHHSFRADDWLMFAQDTPSASGGRGFNRASVFTRDGRLVASVSQEGLIRRRNAGA
jgi:acyl-CoA thioesterase-2